MGRQVVIYSDELYHHGIKGQRWGIRRFQNEDGSLTSDGKERYGTKKKEIKDSYRSAKKELRKEADDARQKNFDKYLKKYVENPYGKYSESEKKSDSDNYEQNEKKINESYAKGLKNAKKLYKEQMSEINGPHKARMKALATYGALFVGSAATGALLGTAYAKISHAKERRYKISKAYVDGLLEGYAKVFTSINLDSGISNSYVKF